MIEEIKCNDNSTVKGTVKIYTFPSDLVPTYQDYLKLEDKEKYLVEQGNNTISSLGLTTICIILAGGTDTITHCAVGTGTPTATTLGTEVGTRVAITHKYIINNEYHLDTFYAKTDPNSSSNVLTESGLFSQLAVGGEMYCSKAISITKNTSITMIVSWTWTFTAI